MGTGAFQLTVKRLGHKPGHSTSSSVKVNTAWSYTSYPPCIFMEWCWIKHSPMNTILSQFKPSYFSYVHFNVVLISAIRFCPQTRWSCIVSFTSRPLYARGNSARYPLDRRLGGFQSRSWHCGLEKNFLPPTGNRNLAVQPLARRYIDWYFR
jgi:hypothetical protein